ncbi:MAG: TraB/GumN family protein [Thiohalocapsa sp.]|jgi:hypothetical protein|uniref:TraB/GumN family protein n=1 Tax=Thiohalocapsa sp. TaxID=2497641 RepID=UPI0025E49F6A|nr:TraB/GumN family protein [Thiohalocapsa sp.]MCG6940766.1 TraB/GumN family protein [Thiohalocapsa sp.]
MLSRITGWRMRRFWLLSLLALAAVGATADSRPVSPADPPASPPASAVMAATGQVYDDGLLFELTRPEPGPPIYLFGTIHSEDPRVLALPDAVTSALDAAETLVLEVVPDADSTRAAAAAMRLADGKLLAHLVPPELYRRCLAAAASRGLPARALEALKPWAVMLLMSMPPSQTGEFLDRRLYNLAQAEGKPTLGLETTVEQLSLFEQFSLAEQRALLDAALAAQADRERMLEDLVGAYLRADLGELLSLSEASEPGLDPAVRRRFRDVLIDARNQRMLHRISALPADRRYFIAVGALHLPGQAGLLAGLDEAGFDVRRLY